MSSNLPLPFDKANAYLAAIVESSDDAIISKNLNGIITSWNKGAERVFGYTAEEAIGRSITMLIPAQRIQEEERIIEKLRKGERLEHFETVRMTKDGREVMVSLTVSPIRDDAGQVIGASKIARDVTRERRLAIIAESQKIALEMAMNNAPLSETLGVLTGGVEKHISQAMASILLVEQREDGAYFRQIAASSLPKAYNDAVDHLRIEPELGSCGAAVFQKETVIVEDIATHPLWKDCKEVALGNGLHACWSRPIISSDGDVLGTFAIYYAESRMPNQDDMEIIDYLAGTASVILERVISAERQKAIEASLREETKTLELLNDLSKQLSSSLDLNQVVQNTTDVLTELTGAEFGAFFYNVVDDEGESYMLYTISGVPREAFSRFPMPRNTSLFSHTFGGKGTVRLDDVRQDPRYGKSAPYHGMPKGHLPVTSYLAVPVISRNGAVLGGLFFGHSKAGIFTERAAHLVESAASYAAVSIDNAQLYTKMQESEHRWRALADAMPQLVWMCDNTGWCDYMSNQWHTYSGVEVKDLLGEGWLNILHPEDRIRAAHAWNEAVADRAPYDLDYRIRAKDGQYRWFRTRGVAVRDEKGRILKWYGTCTDTQELIESRNMAQEANIAKSEFLANMSHEIRTPMNAVVGLANILAQSSPLTAKQAEFIKTLQLSADSLLALINDLLDIAKIEARSVELEKTSFSLTQLIQEVISMVAVRVKEKGLTLTSNADNAQRLMFRGDPARIRQIILNLCSNAVKFTEQGGIDIQLACIPTHHPSIEQIRITVKDTGIGIDKKNLANIFHKFTQADSSINRKYGGTGLGLAITKTLTELMGGTIEVQSTPGEGSSFIIVLPLEREEQPHDAPSQRGEAVESPVSPMHRATVLLVEDYAPNVMVATTFLEHFGFDTDVASNGMEAIEKIKHGHYALALMDVQMHGMNGLEATRIIREYERQHGRQRLPIIGMTAHALTGDRERCLSVGMDDYLPKPFNPDEFKRKLLHYTGESKAA
ncbi:PAS domain S-box protein [bacterium]|nr:PAS domain S-box protein [bacterium]